MELINTILNRRSGREYNDKEIPEKTLNMILEAGLLAPSGKNLLPVSFIKVTDREMLKRLSESKDAGSAMIKGAGAAIVVIGDAQLSDTWIEDCSIALSFMMLRATDLGVHNCWVQSRLRTVNGQDSDKYVSKIMDLPDNYKVLAILSLGMSDKKLNPYKLEDADFSRVHIEKF